MTPNLGQRACCALEDSIVLTKKLAEAIKSKCISVEEAFKAYGSERWPSIFPLTVRAYLVGALLQLDNPLICALRDNIVVHKLGRFEVISNLLPSHTTSFLVEDGADEELLERQTELASVSGTLQKLNKNQKRQLQRFCYRVENDKSNYCS
ncbi:hypothetical protein RND71_024873 [Anisodus tanguticus]|uniref:Uncharacterized protein n=1 Tax=Anisodus tanguticus TaxID=243964 RepID=A0AAE1RR88_9SOLA|nr:hypothetical protein RND71_024873 [Anisodus tanguticus]